MALPTPVKKKEEEEGRGVKEKRNISYSNMDFSPSSAAWELCDLAPVN